MYKEKEVIYMAQTVLGLFEDRTNVEKAINKLKENGLDAKDFSIVMRDTREAKEVSKNTGTNVAGGAVSGATTGIVLGGIAGLIAGMIIPGLGAFLVGGPIAAALGLGGVAASTVSGAATGAVAGGLIGALMGFGLSRPEAEHYEARVKEGAILLAVPATDTQVSEVTQIFEECNATDVKTANQPKEGVQKTMTQRKHADREHRDERESTRSSQTHSNQFASGGAKGGTAAHRSHSKQTGKGWHGDTEHHRQARKGKKTHSR